jgi:hypothetical protein
MNVKDSGKRQGFETGAVRDTQDGKGRYDLLPFHAVYQLARLFEEGAKKYAAENWRKGIPLRRFLDSALRHLMKAAEGQRDEEHFVAAAWNIMCLIETQAMIQRGILPATLNDLPDWTGTKGDPEYGGDGNPDTNPPKDCDHSRPHCPDYEPASGSFEEIFGGPATEEPVRSTSEWTASDALDLMESVEETEENATASGTVVANGIDRDACGTIDGINPLGSLFLADAGGLLVRDERPDEYEERQPYNVVLKAPPGYFISGVRDNRDGTETVYYTKLA